MIIFIWNLRRSQGNLKNDVYIWQPRLKVSTRKGPCCKIVNVYSVLCAWLQLARSQARQTSWLFTNTTEELNQGLPRNQLSLVVRAGPSDVTYGALTHRPRYLHQRQVPRETCLFEVSTLAWCIHCSRKNVPATSPFLCLNPLRVHKLAYYLCNMHQHTKGLAPFHVLATCPVVNVSCCRKYRHY